MKMFIELIKYLVLGIVQGVTEILPVSSSGHLTLFSHLFRMDLSHLTIFLMITNMGSFLALFFFFRKDIVSLVTGVWKYIFRRDETHKEDMIYVLKLLVAVIPIGIVGFLLKDRLPNDLLTVGFSLIITSALLYFIYRSRDIQWKSDVSWKNALIIGAFQMFAIFPGISRSGITMSGGLIEKIELKKVLRFSFLSYIIISIPVSLLGLYEAFTTKEAIHLSGYIVAFMMSFVFSLLSVMWIFKHIKIKNLIYFAGYCFLVGVLSILIHFL